MSTRQTEIQQKLDRALQYRRLQQEIQENLLCLNAARYLYYHASTREIKNMAQAIFLHYWEWFQRQQIPLRLDPQQTGFVLA